MKAIVLLLFIVFLYSCKDENEENICSSATFVFVNQRGEDIFNPSTPNHLEIADFNILSSDSTVKLNYNHYFRNDTNYFEVGLNGLSGEGLTYLKFREINVDTVLTKFGDSGSSLFINELYYNDSLIAKNTSVGECGNQVIHKITIK